MATPPLGQWPSGASGRARKSVGVGAASGSSPGGTSPPPQPPIQPARTPAAQITQGYARSLLVLRAAPEARVRQAMAFVGAFPWRREDQGRRAWLDPLTVLHLGDELAPRPT